MHGAGIFRDSFSVTSLLGSRKPVLLQDMALLEPEVDDTGDVSSSDEGDSSSSSEHGSLA